MSARFFIDTNIWVYAHDKQDPVKQQIAQKIILNGLEREEMVLSTQVVHEFFVTITRKIKEPLAHARTKQEVEYLKQAEIIENDLEMSFQAMDFCHKNRISFWDALIIVAAQSAECEILYSEDMQHGRKHAHLTIINPFLK